jgi:hypothetical protein
LNTSWSFLIDYGQYNSNACMKTFLQVQESKTIDFDDWKFSADFPDCSFF